MTDLTDREMIATILRSLEKTGTRFAVQAKTLPEADERKKTLPRSQDTARTAAKTAGNR